MKKLAQKRRLRRLRTQLRHLYVYCRGYAGSDVALFELPRRRGKFFDPRPLEFVMGVDDESMRKYEEDLKARSAECGGAE